MSNIDGIHSNPISEFNDNKRNSDLRLKVEIALETEYGKKQQGFSNNIMRKIDRFLDLGSTFDLNMDDLGEAEREKFLKILSILLKKGIVGYNYYEVNGKIEKHFLINQIGNERLSNQKIIKNKEGYY